MCIFVCVYIHNIYIYKNRQLHLRFELSLTELNLTKGRYSRDSEVKELIFYSLLFVLMKLHKNNSNTLYIFLKSSMDCKLFILNNKTSSYTSEHFS